MLSLEFMIEDVYNVDCSDYIVFLYLTYLCSVYIYGCIVIYGFIMCLVGSSTGLAIAPNGITIASNGCGRVSGEGFVQFTSLGLVERALEKYKKKIRHRWDPGVLITLM